MEFRRWRRIERAFVLGPLKVSASSEYFELFGAIAIHESNRNAHDPLVIARDVSHSPNFNSIVVIVFRIKFGLIPLNKKHFLVSKL